MIDDHEVTNDLAGGAPPSSNSLFAGQPGDFINETPLFANGLQAFSEFNAIEDRIYSATGNDRFDGAPDLYRYNIYGSDAAVIMVDARTFRDTELPEPANPLSPVQVSQFLSASLDPSRGMLGDIQLARLKQDLLDARDKGVTWKFVMLPEPIQNFGPFLAPGDRYEGYAAERNDLLKFIDENHIENVVFVSSDKHWTSVNNLTYQATPGGPQIASSAFEVVTLAAAAIPPAPLVPPAAFFLGLISAQQLAFYNGLPNAPDVDNIPNDKDDFVKSILNGLMAPLGYDPIGLESGSPINAHLLQGDYFVGHDNGWTDFNVAPGTGQLAVTTWGIPAYSAADLLAHPEEVLARNPTIVSQFAVTPTSKSTIGTEKRDTLSGSGDADVILGAAGNDILEGKDGDDYVDGGQGNDVVFGGEGDDRIFGRDGNDRLYGQGGDDLIQGGLGADRLAGNGGSDTFRYDTVAESEPDDPDLIEGFVSGGASADLIDLSAIDAQASVAGNQAFSFIGAAAFSAEGQIRAVTSSGHTLIQVNTTGLQGPEMVIELDSVVVLTGANFVL
jgi:hypothetical protein